MFFRQNESKVTSSSQKTQQTGVIDMTVEECEVQDYSSRSSSPKSQTSQKSDSSPRSGSPVSQTETKTEINILRLLLIQQHQDEHLNFAHEAMQKGTASYSDYCEVIFDAIRKSPKNLTLSLSQFSFLSTKSTTETKKTTKTIEASEKIPYDKLPDDIMTYLKTEKWKDGNIKKTWETSSIAAQQQMMHDGMEFTLQMRNPSCTKK